MSTRRNPSGATRDDEQEEGRLIQGADSTMMALTKGEIDQQIATAHAYPRSIRKFHSEALDMVTLSEDIADSCIYALPRKDKDGKQVNIEGPSARFAEMIASAYGNCRAGARVVAEEGEFVVAQGAFHDLERNVAITYEVRRRIADKYGRRYSADMIGVTANAACSIALRNAVLKGVPKALWQPIYDAARETAIGNAETLVNRRTKMLAYFQKLGANEEMICKKLGVPGAPDIGLDELAVLKGIATAIKEGETTVEQVFADERAPAKTGGVSGLKEQLGVSGETKPEGAQA